MTARRTLAASTALVFAAVLLAGCSGTDGGTDAGATPGTSATTAPSSAGTATTPAEPTPVATSEEDLTCETMIPSAVVSALTGEGWTATETTLSVGQTAIEDSLVCTWAPAGAFAGQMYGVGRLTDAEEKQLRSDLLAQGWAAEKASEGEYFAAPTATPTPGATSTPAAGGSSMSGFTYLLGDGWVKYSDTKDGILLIVTPVD